MKTRTKKFRAWKNNRLIPNAFPYSDTEIIVGARLNNGTPVLRIEKVDYIEQLMPMTDQLYEGDIVLWEDSGFFKIGIAGLGIVDSWNDEEFYALCYTDSRNLSDKFHDSMKELNDLDLIIDDLYEGIIIGNIHLDKSLEDNDYWDSKCSQIIKDLIEKTK